jgi:hypothetical protein
LIDRVWNCEDIYNSFIQKLGMSGNIQLSSTLQESGISPEKPIARNEPDPDFKSGEVKIFMPKTEKSWKALLLLLPTIKYEINEREQKKIDNAEKEAEEDLN